MFISHAAEDGEIASALKDYLEALFLGVDVFVSSRDLGGGEVWMKSLQARLVKARAIVALATGVSRQNLWVHFEAGAGFAGEKTVPLCADGVSPSSGLLPPLSLLQARAMTKKGLSDLTRDVARLLGQRRPKTFPGIPKVLKCAERISRERKGVPAAVVAPPARKSARPRP